jgi:lysozyme family protein
MPNPAYDAALPFVLRWEGGFVDHPKDPGGRTNKGVTQRVYTAWLARRGLPDQDVKRITDTEVKAIYESDYWLPPRCDVLPTRLDLVQFDTAVNMGVGRAVRFLQSAVGCGVDGQFGSGTLQAVAGCDPRGALARYCETREAFYRRLVARNPDLAVFLKGWMNRLNSLRSEVGLPVFGFSVPANPADAGPMLRVPDIGEDPDFDV